MAERSRSSKSFLERAGIRLTIPVPHPVHDTGINPAHTLLTPAPLPIPEFLGNTQGNPRPDRGTTEEWPTVESQN